MPYGFVPASSPSRVWKRTPASAAHGSNAAPTWIRRRAARPCGSAVSAVTSYWWSAFGAVTFTANRPSAPVRTVSVRTVLRRSSYS